MPLDGTTYKQDPEVEEHPAAALTPSERAKAIAYLEWLDCWFARNGMKGWFQDGAGPDGIITPGRCRAHHCLVSPAGQVAGIGSALRAMGFDNEVAAPIWNDHKDTTFAMVHTRVKDTLAVLRGLG